MTPLDNRSATKPPSVAFGVSRLWIPHVALICFIYYVFLSPHQYAGRNAFWALGAYVRDLVGGRVVNAGAALMWIVHLFEAGYTVILARRYETTLTVGVRLNLSPTIEHEHQI